MALYPEEWTWQQQHHNQFNWLEYLLEFFYSFFFGSFSPTKSCFRSRPIEINLWHLYAYICTMALYYITSLRIQSISIVFIHSQWRRLVMPVSWKIQLNSGAIPQCLFFSLLIYICWLLLLIRTIPIERQNSFFHLTIRHNEREREREKEKARKNYFAAVIVGILLLVWWQLLNENVRKIRNCAIFSFVGHILALFSTHPSISFTNISVIRKKMFLSCYSSRYDLFLSIFSIRFFSPFIRSKLFFGLPFSKNVLLKLSDVYLNWSRRWHSIVFCF